MKAINVAANRVPADATKMGDLLEEIGDTVHEAIWSLSGGQGTIVTAKDAGELVQDIGLGFSFDLLDGRVPKDNRNIAERQGRLLWSQRALTTFIDSNGQDGDLLNILLVFMGKMQPLN
jgi:hypothetical protein